MIDPYVVTIEMETEKEKKVSFSSCPTVREAMAWQLKGKLCRGMSGSRE